MHHIFHLIGSIKKWVKPECENWDIESIERAIASKLIQNLLDKCPVLSKNWLKTPKIITVNLFSVQHKAMHAVLMKMCCGLWGYCTSPPSLLPSNNDGPFSLVWGTHLHLHHHQALLPYHEMYRKPFCHQNKFTNCEWLHKNHKQLVVEGCIAVYWFSGLGVSLSCHFCNGAPWCHYGSFFSICYFPLS